VKTPIPRPGEQQLRRRVDHRARVEPGTLGPVATARSPVSRTRLEDVPFRVLVRVSCTIERVAVATRAGLSTREIVPTHKVFSGILPYARWVSTARPRAPFPR
jgi:hypothetical protein